MANLMCEQRHRLVKGCGGDKSSSDVNGTSANSGSHESPVDRSDVMSDGTEGSPKTAGSKTERA